MALSHLSARPPSRFAQAGVMPTKALEWDLIERMPCTIKLLPVPKGVVCTPLG